MDDSMTSTSSNDELFTSKNGITYFRGVEIMNFSLKKEGLLKSTSEQMVVYRLRTRQSGCEIPVSKRIVLDFSSFVSREAFRKALENATKNLYVLYISATVNAGVLSQYFSFLEADSGEANRYFNEANYLGYHQPGIWILSDDIQIQNGQCLSKVDQNFIIKDKTLQAGYLDIRKLLIESPVYTNELISRIIQLLDHLKDNKSAFLNAMGLAALRLFKSTEDSCTSSGETKYGCLCSISKSIGKTSMLVMLARGCGIPATSHHPYMMAGGDGQLTGTTVNLQMQTMTKTNQLVFLNEMKLSSEVMAKTLNQSHEKFFSSGSCARGFVTPIASMLGTSNDVEPHERLHGRMMIIKCGGGKISDQDEEAIEERLLPLINENVGWLLTWVIQNKERWDGMKNLTRPLVSLIQRLLKTDQRRLAKCYSNTLLVLYMIIISSQNKSCGTPLDLFFNLVCPNLPDEQKFQTELIRKIIERIQEDEEFETWFNPFLTFTTTNEDGVDVVPSFAVRMNILKSLEGINYTKCKDFISSFGDKTYNVTAGFFLRKQNIRNYNRAGSEKKNAKCGKIPWSAVPNNLRCDLLKVCGLENKDFPSGNAWERALHCDAEVKLITEEEETMVCELWNTVVTNFERGPQGILPNDSNNVDIAQELTPLSKLRYQTLSPKGKDIFQSGYRSGVKRRLVEEEN